VQIEESTKLDFCDVLIKPKRSKTASRKDVVLTRDFHFYHSPKVWEGVPVMIANMDTTGCFEIAKVAAKNKIITCLHKHYSFEELHSFFLATEETDYIWVSLGMKDDELDKIMKLQNELYGTHCLNLCIDVANGQTDKFVEYCAKVRKLFPESIIMAGNVVDGGCTKELILHGGVDIVKVGIGSGCFVAGTKVKTKDSHINIELLDIGDYVLTHTGEYKKVLNKLERNEYKDLFQINNIQCTENHELYVLHKDLISICNDDNIHSLAQWIRADELTVEYLLIEKIDDK